MADQITKPAETSDLELAVHEAKDDVSVRSGRGKEFSSPIIDEEAERSYRMSLDFFETKLRLNFSSMSNADLATYNLQFANLIPGFYPFSP